MWRRNEGMVSDIYQQIRQARRQKGLRQTEVATQIGARQSAVSMFERGRSDALSEAKVKAFAELVGVTLDAAALGRTPSRDVGRGVLKYCPHPDCPANVPFVVGGGLVVRPNLVRAAAGTNTACRYCGEWLEESCAACGVGVADQPVCMACGAPYVDGTKLAGDDPAAWAQAQRTRNRDVRDEIDFADGTM